MKKMLFFPVVILTSLFVSNSAFASIDQNLKYGQKNTEVSELQEFLSAQGFLSSSPTGFFGLMTLKAVKAYQISQKLPSTGFVGPMTRERVNADIAVEVESSNEAEIAETGTTTPIVNTPVYVAPAPTPTPAPQPVPKSAPVVEAPKPIKYLSVSLANTQKAEDFIITSNKEIDFSKLEITKNGNDLPVTVTSSEKEIFGASICRNNICEIRSYKVKLAGVSDQLNAVDSKMKVGDFKLKVTDTEGQSATVPFLMYYESNTSAYSLNTETLSIER